ncbi:hypothetical protein CU633_04510 [Bacillus sp. V3-13]|uniref:hypothetical protein n=1 Tax=Bacillus sp. V3-13 TaxID=2053728 RepID=UPI000C7903E8|nr:hypothetical protein [Bacillus sp. V3-13]PLR78495.1 hypothetical protein CU633_04510 [Bacillus sp. V3-13]
MTRTERYHLKPKSFFLKGLFIAIILCTGLFAAFNHYAKSQIKIEAPAEDLGRKVVIQLPNGKELKTFENLIIKHGEKMYYQGERNKIDVSGGKIIYENWE